MRTGTRSLRWGLVILWVAAGPIQGQEASGCAIYGTVVDAQSNGGIPSASVWLERADGDLVAGRATSADGAFAFELPSCTPLVVRVEMLGFQPAEYAVSFEGGAGQYQVTIRLMRAPLEVEELRVEVPKSLRLQEAGFYARKAWVEGIEVYRAMSPAVPEEFRDYDSTRCGAVVVWTRRGRP